MHKKNILILGGSGFIGSHLSRRLAELGHEISIEGDITDYEDVSKHVRGKDVIVNLATVVQKEGSFDPYKDLKINAEGQINVLEARKNANPDAAYIYIGSSMQFGRVPEADLPIAEDYRHRPISLYGAHKTIAENYGDIYSRAFGLPSIVLRLPPVYGPSLSGRKTRSMIEYFVRQALANSTFRVYNFGRDLKDFVYVDDVVDALVRIIESPIREGTFNAGSGAGIPFSDVAQMIVEACGSGSYELVPSPEDSERFELGSFYFDTTKIREAFGWVPKIGIKEGIKNVADAFRDKPLEL